MTDVEERVEAVAGRLKRTQWLSAALAVTVTWGVVLPRIRTDEVVSIHGAKFSQFSGMRIDRSHLDYDGLTVSAPRNYETTAYVRAPRGRAAVGVRNDSTLFEAALSERTGALSVRAVGRVSSEIHVDTNTGAWVLERRLGDRVDRIQLVAPLSESVGAGAPRSH